MKRTQNLEIPKASEKELRVLESKISNTYHEATTVQPQIIKEYAVEMALIVEAIGL